MEFHIYLFIIIYFQHKPKAIVMSNLALPLVEVINIWKLINIKSIKDYMDIECGLMVSNTKNYQVFFFYKISHVAKRNWGKTIFHNKIPF
jgi:hypothetical protein